MVSREVLVFVLRGLRGPVGVIDFVAECQGITSMRGKKAADLAAAAQAELDRTDDQGQKAIALAILSLTQVVLDVGWDIDTVPSAVERMGPVSRGLLAIDQLPSQRSPPYRASASVSWVRCCWVIGPRTQMGKCRPKPQRMLDECG
ncbi:hypothetical protein [Embleya sp. NBC_00896]|uniref:hypothetical protein n=1 Tax=Embleya sp. NBC_00896 TaxID=2975961 RepID=UPI003867606D|nr:hypothetical protein OG928_33365 [Embleya sp. NBC_00896]